MDEQTLADRWTDRHINRPCEQTGQKGENTRSKQIGKPTDLRANRQTDRQRDQQTGRNRDMQTTDRWTDRH